MSTEQKNGVKKNITNSVFQFSVIGFFSGLVITVTGYAIALSENDLVFTFQNLAKLHSTNEHLFILTLLPFLILLAGVFAGRVTYKVSEKFYDLQHLKNNNLHELKNFAEELSKGNLEIEYTPEKGNQLGNIMIELRNNLLKNKEEDARRKKEDEQRNWTATGLAQFGETLRNNNSDMNLLANEVISQLCAYINAVQGGLFLIDDQIENDIHFELMAHFAYNRKKYSQHRVGLSEGLIGRAAYEKRSIYLDEVPDDYIEVTSGLGEANPRVLLIVPIKTEDAVLGVLEISSFTPFEQYVIEFVEKVAGSIATTISAVKTNLNNQKMLEDSKVQEELRKQQEEEMRQNIEEMTATQEDFNQRSAIFESFENAIDNSFFRAEFDLNGNLVSANNTFISQLGYATIDDIKGHHVSMFVSPTEHEDFNHIWDELTHKKNYEKYLRFTTKNGKDVWMLATFSAQKSTFGTMQSVLFIGIESTKQKETEITIKNQIDAVNESCIMFDYASSGRMTSYNQKFATTLGFTDDQLKDYNVFNLMSSIDQDSFESIWNEIINGKPYSCEVKVKAATTDIWLAINFTPIQNDRGEYAQIVAIANDITLLKLAEETIKRQDSELKTQAEQLEAAAANLDEAVANAKQEVKAQSLDIERIKMRNEKTLEGLRDAVVTISREGNIEFFNRAAESLWGYTRLEVLGQNIKKLFRKYTEEDNEFMANLLHPDKRKTVGMREKVEILAKDGTEKPVVILLSGAKVQNEYTYTAFIQFNEAE